MKFENVKIGDVVAVSNYAGINSGGLSRQVTHYRKLFFTLHTVDRVIKTQFCCGKLKFHKDRGDAVTNFGSGTAYFQGDNVNLGFGTKVKVPDECQAIELCEYKKAMRDIREFASYNNHFNLFNCKSVSDALKAVKLLNQVTELAPHKESNR